MRGIGGAGKTQLVLQYRQDYSAVFWVEAGSRESIDRDYVQIYHLLYNVHHVVGQQITQIEDAVPAVKRWFYGRKKRWLFVLDSADAISDTHDPGYINLRRYLPGYPSIHVTVATRDGTA